MTKTLSAYRILWIQVLFDLPVLTKKERKAAANFRKCLLDIGFSMVQFSVYQRFCANKEWAEKYIKKVEKEVPEYGKIHVLTFTDKQYENIITFNGRKKKDGQKNPEQYELF
jgi:CRISPR-associated protein Cas2